MDIKVVDLHCDLLGSVIWSEGKLNLNSPDTNCSMPQLKAGGVFLQVLAVAGITDLDAVASGKAQVELYQKLLAEYSEEANSYSRDGGKEGKRAFLFAIENASVLAGEDEPLDLAFERFNAYNSVEKIVYISLTWNQENRFGGGNASSGGLKEDGKTLLEFMSGKKVAVDFSHTSDQLAGDIFEYIDKKGLDVPVMASHSNFRAVKDHLRNLPDAFAKQIIARDGVIGMNFVKRFLGDAPEDVIRHMEYGLKLGGEKSICLGADFYGDIDVPPELCPGRIVPPFYEEIGNSSCYPKLASWMEKSLSEEQIESIFHKNALSFLQNFC